MAKSGSSDKSWTGNLDSRPSSSTSPKASQGPRTSGSDMDWRGQDDSRPSSSTKGSNPTVKTGK